MKESGTNQSGSSTVATAIVGATVIDGTGRAPINDGVVIVAGERIRSVTRAGDAVVPTDTKVVQAQGKYVIPGLMDANVHLFSGVTPDLLLQHQGRYPELIEEAAQVALRSGVTTAFDTWGPLEALVEVRDRINRGDTIGCRMFVAGNIIGFGGPLSEDLFPTGSALHQDTVDDINQQWEQGVGPELMWLTPEQVRRRVRAYIERSQLDFVKYAASGHIHLQYITFSERVQRVIVEEAQRAGLTVQAHTTTPESLRMEIEAGAGLLQHGDSTGRQPMPDVLLKTIVDRAIPVAALVCTERHLSWNRLHGHPLVRIPKQTRDENDRRLIKAGARLLLTTDSIAIGPKVENHPLMASYLKGSVDCPTRLGEGHFLWLEAVTERGMTPMDALVAATRNVAEAYGHGNDLGTLERGKRADLLVLDADPLGDVRNYRKIAAVVKDGTLVDRAKLPRRRIVTEQHLEDDH